MNERREKERRRGGEKVEKRQKGNLKREKEKSKKRIRLHRNSHLEGIG
jgi:hypothetical protein